MSYDNPNRQTYSFGIFDFGGGATEQFVVQGPKGKAGTLIDYGVQAATEVFTTGGTVAVGTSADPDAFGEELAIGTLAVNSGLSVRSSKIEQADIDALIVNPRIPADTPVYVTCVNTGGTPTGMAIPFVTIDWAW